MGTTVEKAQAILNSKLAIKAEIEAKGVKNVGDILSKYSSKIASIQTTTPSYPSKFTGHADTEGLKAIGWTDEDIQRFQNYALFWNEEDDDLYKVPQALIDKYKEYLSSKNLLIFRDNPEYVLYSPKFDLSEVTDFVGVFYTCVFLIGMPSLDFSNITHFSGSFALATGLKDIPALNTSKAVDVSLLFQAATSLESLPELDLTSATDASNLCSGCTQLKEFSCSTSGKVTNFERAFEGCVCLKNVKILDISSATNLTDIFTDCISIVTLNLKGLNTSLDIAACKYISKESLLYIINNSIAATPITIKLDPDAYTLYNSDPEILAALESKTNLSLTK